MESIARKTRAMSVAVAALAALMAAPAHAAGEAIDFRWHHFADNQGTNVSTTTFDVAKPFGTENGRIAVTYSLDMVSMPAIEGVPGSEEHLDALTTASRPVSGEYQESDSYEKRRHQLEGAVGLRNLTGTFYTSIEEDWHAYQAGLSWQRTLAQENTLLALDGSFGWDEITPIVEEGSPARDERRTGVSMVGTWQQTLNV